MIKVGQKIKEYKVVGVNSSTYLVVNDNLTSFIGYKIITSIKKSDLERICRNG